MTKSSTALLIYLLIFPAAVFAQQVVKQSDLREINDKSWVHFHDQDNVSFLGQLGVCNEREIIKLRVINRNPESFEIRIGYVNGSKRLIPSIFIIQPMQEVELSCTGMAGVNPNYLADGKSIRIESQVIKRK
jgi:hypothetical protein